MEIAGVLTAGKLLSTAFEQLGKRGRPQQATTSQLPQTPKPAAAATAATSAFREIVADYDVTDISPGEFSEMIQKLHDAGLLTDQQFQELSLIRVELDSEGVEPDQTVDLLDFYLDRLRQLHQSLEDGTGLSSPSRQPPLASMGRRLQWVEKFASMQPAVNGAGLDALA